MERKYDEDSIEKRDCYKWVHFLVPFLQYISKLKFGLQKILEPDDEESREILKECIKDFTERLAQRKIETSLNTEPFADLKSTIEELKSLKDALLESPTKDNEFYYELGLWSLIFHRLASLDKPYNYALYRICMCIMLHFGTDYFEGFIIIS